MSKVKIRIELEECWNWWPVTEVDDLQLNAAPSHQLHSPPTLEVDQELIDRYTAAAKVYRELQEALENLYRVQEGMAPWTNQGLPDHTKL